MSSHTDPMVHLRLETELFEQVREVAFRRRMSKTAIMNYLIEVGLKALPEIEAREAKENLKGALPLPTSPTWPASRNRSW